MSSPWQDDLQVFCADIGSIARGNFGWARRYAASTDEEAHASDDIRHLADAVATELEREVPVALGFETPLFVPVPADSDRLGKARPSDKGYPAWSSQIGGSVFATGLVQVAWVLRTIKERCAVPLSLDWAAFAEEPRGLFIWEAFISGPGKGDSHVNDAEIAIELFCDQLPSPGHSSVAATERPFSLAAAAATWAGWEVASGSFRSSCMLVRPA